MTGTALVKHENKNTLPINIETISDAELNAALGFENKRTKFNKLKINKHAEDENEKPLPVGAFYIEGPAQTVFSKTINVRVLYRGYQYNRFDEKLKKTVDSTVILNTFFGDFLSVSGKIACGRLTRKQVEDLGTSISAEQADLQKQTKMKQLIFLLVSYKGTTQDGEEVEVKDELVLYTPGFNGAKVLDEAIKGIVKEGKALLRTNITLKTKRDKTGDNVYYVPVATVDTKTTVEATKQDIESLKEVMKFRDGINKYVGDAYDKALRGENDDAIDASFVEVTTPETDDETAIG